MRVALDPIEAFEHTLQLSLQFEKALESQSQPALSERISHIFIRALDSDASPFVPAEQINVLWRALDIVIYYVSSFFYTRHVVPYNLEENLEYLHLLFDKIRAGAAASSEVEEFPREMRHRLRKYFGGDCRVALSSLIGRVEAVVAKHSLAATRREALGQKIASIREVFESIETLPHIVHGRVVIGQEGQELRNQLRDLRKIQDYDLFCSAIRSAEERLKRIKASLSAEDAFSICHAIVSLKFERKLARLAGPMVLRRSIMFQDKSPLEEHVQNSIDDYEDTYDQILDGLDYLKTYSTTLTGDVAEIDKLARDLKLKLLEVTEEQLHKVFVEIGRDLTSKITRTESLIDFYAVHEEVRKSICDLIELDTSIEDEVLYRVFHTNIQELGEQFQNARLPRQTEILNKEVLPQVQTLLLQACSTTDVEKISNLQREVASYIVFLQKTQNQLTSEIEMTSRASLEVLDRIIRTLQEADAALQQRLEQLAKENPNNSSTSATQTASGDGTRVLINNSPGAVVTFGGTSSGSRGGEDDSFFSQVIRGMLPTGGITSTMLAYGPQVLLSAATIYLTGSVSLTTSILSGMALTAAPAVVTSAVNVVARQVLPQPLVPLMAPVVDFAMRLLVLRYGSRVVELLAGAASAPAVVLPQSASGSTSSSAASSSTPPSGVSGAMPSARASAPSQVSAPTMTTGNVLFAAGASVAAPIAKVALNRIGVVRAASIARDSTSILPQPALERTIRVQNRARTGSDHVPKVVDMSTTSTYSTNDAQSTSGSLYWNITGIAMKAMGYVAALFMVSKRNQGTTI